MAPIKPHSPVLLPIIASLLCLLGVSWGATETEILIKFKNSLSNVTFLADWDKSVFGLRLENMSLKGVIDIDTLMGLPNLRTLSFMTNNFNGSMPSVKELSSLKVLYLSYNQFSREIPEDALSGVKALQKVYLARNQSKITGGVA